jgi:N-acetylglucosamine-6-phosphate deacetylase
MTTFHNVGPLKTWLQIEHGRIIAVGTGEPPPSLTRGRGLSNPSVNPTEDVVDVQGGWVLPGFVDTHCHGAGGAALYSGDPDDVIRAARSHLEHGTTTLLASVATMRLDLMLNAAKAITQAVASGQAPNLRGIHFEGPFLSPNRRGAQTESALLTPNEQTALVTDPWVGSARLGRRTPLSD